MSDYVKRQFATALRTLPWYVGIPAVLSAAIIGPFALFDGGPKDGYWTLVRAAAFFGVGIWVVRQAVRALWTVRMVTTGRAIVPH